MESFVKDLSAAVEFVCITEYTVKKKKDINKLMCVNDYTGPNIRSTFYPTPPLTQKIAYIFESEEHFFTCTSTGLLLFLFLFLLGKCREFHVKTSGPVLLFISF